MNLQRPLRTRIIVLCVTCCAGTAASGSLPRADPWDELYRGAHATGGHVIALWQFQPGAETEDSSGNGHHLRLAGARIHPEGRFGACLESDRGMPIADARHAAFTPHAPELSPRGAFTLEMWMRPKPELAEYGQAFLIDKMYVSKDDYQLVLESPTGSGRRRLRATLGFGDETASWHSDEMTFEAGTWYHVAFTYDGAGSGRFWINGQAAGESDRAGRRGISGGTRLLSLGDRVGSYYYGFPGHLDQVRISTGVREFRRLGVTEANRRRAFVRLEPVPVHRFRVQNLWRSPVRDVVVTASLDGLNPKKVELPEIEPGESAEFEYEIDTSLRPDRYSLRLRLEVPGERSYHSEETFPVTIVPRPLPRRMPVVMWGIGGVEHVTRETPRLKEIGFTHCLGLGADYGRIWNAGEPTEAYSPERLEATWRMLDEALVNDLGIIVSLSPGRWAGQRKEFQRIDRDGKPYARTNLCANFPEMHDFCRNVGASVARTWGGFPTLSGALVHTEVRDGSQVCFHDHDRRAWQDETGLPLPEVVTSKNGVDYRRLTDFPADRVIPDDHPVYRYLQWWWQRGDGWNALHSAVHGGFRSTGRDDLWTFFDPAVRAASVSGSGGRVDYLSQWTYSYPDPIRIGLATDELARMAEEAGHPQGIMKMTQLIWYRSQTAPPADRDNAVADLSAWEDYDPDAQYITIAPMHLREAFWTKISRPVQGIMYHGWQSLVPVDGASAYRHTHPETSRELARLIRQVVEPLGPTLMQVPAAPTDVAFLESFASQMFAGRGTYGWGRSWAGDAYHVLMYAGLQPEVVYDETIARGGLDGYRILVMTDCDVLTQSVAEQVRAFQEAGGLVIGDEELSPAITPDIRLKRLTRTRKADHDKQALLTRATELRETLEGRYRRYVESSNPEIVPWRRRFGETDYVFAVNDHREFGQYVGRHGLVMENGLPAESALTIDRTEGAVYDLLTRLPVQADRTTDGRLSVPVRLEPGGGALYMITPRPIKRLQLAVAPQAESAASGGPRDKAHDDGERDDFPSVPRGGSHRLVITVLDDAEQPLNAIVPLQVDVIDPDGRPAEFSGSYGAASGQLQLRLEPAANDTPGVWQVRVQELASGRTATHAFRLK